MVKKFQKTLTTIVIGFDRRVTTLPQDNGKVERGFPSTSDR